MKRSSITMQNLQEIVSAESSIGRALQKGLAQYETPPLIADQIASAMWRYCKGNPSSVIDPQCGSGVLLHAFPWITQKYGIEMDNDFREREGRDGLNRITANCVQVGGIIEDLFPDAVWECGVANYPFGLTWKSAAGESNIRSWQWTWEFLLRRTKYGTMIGNSSEIEHLQTHPAVVDYKEYDWQGANVRVAVVTYRSGIRACTPKDILLEKWNYLRKVLAEENRKTPDFNIWLQPRLGRTVIRTYLSTRHTIKRKLTHDDIQKLARIDEQTPESMAVDRESRTILQELVDCGVYKVQPEADSAIRHAISEARRVAIPIMPVTDFERVAYLDEEDYVTCVSAWGPFKAGEKYKISSHVYSFSEAFIRRKPYFNMETGETFMEAHDCLLSGQDRAIRVHHPGGFHTFMDKPTPDQPKEISEQMLWNIFAMPAVPTVADRFPDLVLKIHGILDAIECIADMKFMPGQREYLARVLTKDHALIAAKVGTGKTLMTIAAYLTKAAHRCLIVCPKGTSTSSTSEPDEDDDSLESGVDRMSQWLAEVVRFAPHIQVFELFSMEDYERIRTANDGELPDGIYLTYYEALLTNGAREKSPMKANGEFFWRDSRLYELTGQLPPLNSDLQTKLVSTIGKESEGIRCIALPSMATCIGHEFDMVCFDEAHKLQSSDSARTEAAVRLQPKYRYAFTASPIPNVVSDLFSIVGWLCVPGWYAGGACNAAWPYRKEDLALFNSHFLAVERDLTAEEHLATTGKKRQVKRPSPVISSPARLLKILKPTIAYITKEQCNPAYVPAHIIDIRVPMGKQQAARYGYFTDRNHVTMTTRGKNIAANAMIRAASQIEWLRGICCDPRGVGQAVLAGRKDVPPVHSNFNPKIISILELVIEKLQAGQQVVIVNSRIGITDELHRRLQQAGVRISRIDSSPLSGNPTDESTRFKERKTDVMLMGIKCAMGYSFDQCRNLIIGSLEYSPGSFEQAKGRVDRLMSKGAFIYCILFENSIEELMFDTVALKDDASKIILEGRRVPRDFVPVDMSEVLGQSILNWKENEGNHVDEKECELRWPEIMSRFHGVIGS